jgi:hypothetical protein
MKSPHRRLLVAGLLVLCPVLSPAEEGSSAWQGLERMMPPEEFESAGLGKLSPAELDRLNGWLMHFLARDAAQVVEQDKEIRSLQNAPLRSRIVGLFTGWSGDTTFQLDNGSVWKQRVSGRYRATLENPEVEISKNLLGFFELKVVSTGRKIGVTRLR